MGFSLFFFGFRWFSFGALTIGVKNKTIITLILDEARAKNPWNFRPQPKPPE